MNEHQRSRLRRVAPLNIDALWQEDQYVYDIRGHNISEVQHMHCENLRVWCSDETLDELLQDRHRCEDLVRANSSAILQLGIQVKECLNPESSSIVWYAPCVGCNTPYDAG
jgi:hypothetical protein